MKTLAGFVLICVVNFVAGEGGEEPKVCKTPVAFSKDKAECGKGQAPIVASFGGAFEADVSTNGYAVQVNQPATTKITVKIGDHEYHLLQSHIHLGREGKEGSQHTVDKKYYQMELHMDFQGDSGYATLGFFVQEGGKDNEAFKALVDALKAIPTSEGGTVKAQVNLADITSHAMTGAYYQYTGSHTTKCIYDILMTVYTQPLEISKAQMDAFKALYKDDQNFRPLVPLTSKLYKSDC